MPDEYDWSDEACPKCSHELTHTKPCDNWPCDDGYCDEHEEDPINFAPGEAYTVCRECRGTGHLRWCPACGHDLNSEPTLAATTDSAEAD